ncbi:MAG: 5-(carboxyamino)imidazole ribonucleotide mutase [Spirochaetia bacterium]
MITGRKPLVGIIMGSDSDLPVMAAACAVLEELKVPFETTIVSAHRTPDRMYGYAKEAEDRGLEVIIAGAGGAAHLPGMTASLTSLPVIGVPVRSSNLQGLDSLLSIVQMPRGIPVATVAINNAKNAGLLAARMLGIKYPEVRSRLEDYTAGSRREVEEKAAKLENQGFSRYLEEM